MTEETLQRVLQWASWLQCMNTRVVPCNTASADDLACKLECRAHDACTCYRLSDHDSI